MPMARRGFPLSVGPRALSSIDLPAIAATYAAMAMLPRPMTAAGSRVGGHSMRNIRLIACYQLDEASREG